MTRKVYVYDPETKEMVEKGSIQREWGQLVVGDLPDFISPIDRSIVNGRAGLREHNHIHGVTNASDYTNQWAKQAKERGSFLTGKANEQERKQAVAEAFKRVKDGYRPKTQHERDFNK